MKKIDRGNAMDDARFDGLLRQALAELAAEEAPREAGGEIAATPIEQRRRRPWLLRGARMAATAAVVSLVAFSGICLASPAIRDQLFSLVERNWGSYTEIHVERGAPEETANAADEQSKITVDPDDPRLQYVHPNWCGHYYPLNAYAQFERVTQVNCRGANPTNVEQEDGFSYSYISDENRERALAYDYSEIVFKTDFGWDLQFCEDGRSDASLRYNTRFDDVKCEIIDGRKVFVTEKGGNHDPYTGETYFSDDYYVCYRWWEGDHLLTLSGHVDPEAFQSLFRSVERIR